jgi:cadmium resistance protein CadD (predicted permease)
MEAVLATIAAAVVLFAATNVDDMVVLAVLNASSRACGRPAKRDIWAGQYAGVAVLTCISLVAAMGLALVSQSWIWILGLMPLGLGVRKLVTAIRTRNSGAHPPPAVVNGLAGVIGLTIANGGDNIAAYTPVFRTLGAGRTAVTIAVFAAGVAVWCLAASRVGSHQKITQLLGRYGQWIIPAVYFVIGLYIIGKSGVAGHIV